MSEEARSIDRDTEETLQRIGKGVVQSNHRLARILEWTASFDSGSQGKAVATGADVWRDSTLDLLDALDSFRRSAPKEEAAPRRRFFGLLEPRASAVATASGSSTAAAAAGLELARAAVLDRLARQDITPLPDEGEFDAEVHEAVERVLTADVALDQTIARTHRCGWIHGRGADHRVLRRALVAVYVHDGSRER